VIALRLLGPLEVLVDGRRVQIAGGREGALLAMLAINAGKPVALDRIVEELWEGEPPGRAVKSVQVYVSRLRKALGNNVIETTGAGYLLRVSGDELDSTRFESLATEGKNALERDDVDAAEKVLTDALRLWRGEPLADFRFAGFAQDEIRRLEELHGETEADYVDVQLARGEVAAAIPRLRALIEAQPLAERPRAQLMLALYRAGRAAEALELYRETRTVLDRELGIEPSSELSVLERRILNRDASLGATRGPRVTTAARRAAPLALVGGVLLLAAAVATGLVLVRGGGDHALAAAAPGSVGAIDPGSNKLVAQIGIGGSPTGVAVGGGRVWVADAAGQEAVAVDPHRAKVVERVPVAAAPTQIAAGPRGAWTTNPLNIDVGVLTHIDPRTQSVRRVPVRTAYVADLFAPATPNALALDGDTVWTNTLHARLVRVRGNKSTRFDVGAGHSIDGIAVGGGSLWVASAADDTVLRFDRSGKRLATVPIRAKGGRPVGPAAVAVGTGAVWVANALAGTVTRIDPRTNTVAATVPVGRRPTAVAVGEGGVWVLNAGDGSVSRIDPDENGVVDTVPVGRGATGIAAGAGRVWVTVAGGHARNSAPPKGPAHPLVNASCGQLQSGGQLPDLVIASDFAGFDNGGRVNQPVVDMRRAISAVFRERGYRAGPYRVGVQHCTDSSPGDSPSFPLCAANARAYAGNASVIGVIGAYQSSCSMVELPVLNAASSGPVPMISPANTYVGLTHAGPQTSPTEPDQYYPTGVRNYARLSAPDDAQGAALAQLAKQLHRRRLFLLDDGDPTGTAMVQYVANAARHLGLSVVGREHWGKPGYDALARRVLRTRPDAVVLTGCICSNGGDLLVTLRRTLGRSVAVLASDNFTFAGSMAAGAPPEAFGVYISQAGQDPAAASPATRAFLERVFPGRPLSDIGPFAPLSAAATQALLDAIRRSDGSRASVAEELTRGRALTVVGGVSFDANGDPVRTPISIYRISKQAPPGPHLAVSGLELDRVIQADPALAGP
jgi:YVTN family beta-propeller protein